MHAVSRMHFVSYNSVHPLKTCVMLTLLLDLEIGNRDLSYCGREVLFLFDIHKSCCQCFINGM